MIFLGIDPGLISTGIVILKKKGQEIELLEYCVIETSNKEKIETRLGKIMLSLEAVILKYDILMCAVENNFVNKNPLSSINLSYVKGIILALMGKKGIAVLEIASTSVKKRITGFGRSEKSQVYKMLKLIIKNMPNLDNHHITDAAAIAYMACIDYRNLAK